MVKAVETSLRELLEGSKQYQVPLYQRTYSWRKEQLNRLWADIVSLAEDRAARPSAGVTHFMGSLVLAPTPDVGPVGVSRYLVVDGQQRLTTLTLLLAAIRDHRVDTEGPDHRDRIDHQFLVNPWRKGDERLKVLPTQADRATYLACIDSGHKAGAADSVGDAYRLFRGLLADHDDPDDEEDIELLEESVLSGLALVSVTTTKEDNVHRIFESLNNTGLRLTQADLLRNYLFMRLPTRGDVVYETQWKPLQDRLTNDQMELLFWLDAVQIDDAVNQRDTYQAQVARMDKLVDEDDIEHEVARFNRLSLLLQRMLQPDTETDPGVRLRLQRLNAWGTTTVYPLLLHLLDRRERGDASSEEIAAAMLVAESYLVRRVITGRATANVNRILLRAVPEIRNASPADAALRGYLSTGRKFFATDQQVRSAVRTTSFYFSGRSTQRKLLLSWIEQTYPNAEPANPAQSSIEHVMPQTLTQSWRVMLKSDLEEGESATDVYDGLVHTIGNLTLTGENQKLGNKSFAYKRAQFAKSGFKMNQAIATEDVWNRAAIQGRADDLADRIITHWPGPDGRSTDDVELAQWGLMNRVLAEVPAGCWTTYSAVAQVIGSHQVPVGQRIANHPVPNGHRVLRADGATAEGFRWIDEREESQREVLELEGVTFLASGKADPAQQLDALDLAELAAIDLPDELLPDLDDGSGRHESFLRQLGEVQPSSVAHGVVALLDGWIRLGGSLEYGSASETSCFLVAREGVDSIWPLALYPSGRAEATFQYLKVRPPFDDVHLRQELMARLNAVDGIDLPEVKVGMRPSFELTVLADVEGVTGVLAALAWFMDQIGVNGESLAATSLGPRAVQS